MELLKDLWASAVSIVRERTTNPLTISFAMSWVAWNYKFPLLLFSELSTPEKITQINLLYPNSGVLWSGALLYPFLTAIFYVFGYSFVAERVVAFYRRRQIATANAVRLVERERLLSVEESTNLVRRHEDELRVKVDTEMQLRSQIDHLKKALAAAEDEAQAALATSLQVEEEKPLKAVGHDVGGEALSDNLEPSGPSEAPSPRAVNLKDLHSVPAGIRKLSEQQLRILTALSEAEIVEQRALRGKFSVKPFYVDADIDFLESHGLLKVTGMKTVYLTKSGRAVLAEFVRQGLWNV